MSDQLVMGVANAGANEAGAFMGGNTTQEVAGGGALVGSIVTAMLPAGMAAGPVGLAITGAVIGISLAAKSIAHLIDGCGETCTYATAVVNQAEGYVQQISQAYWATPYRTKKFQAWTLDQLDQIFNRVRQLCDPAKLGDAGTRCITERLTRGYRPPWCYGQYESQPLSQCGGWYDVTYDPIMNDANVNPDPPMDQVTESIQSAGLALSGGQTVTIAGRKIPLAWLFIGGVVFIMLARRF